MGVTVLGPDINESFYKFNVNEDKAIRFGMGAIKGVGKGALETGIQEKEWDDGVNKGVDKHYGSKYDEAKTSACHTFVNKLVPNGEEKVKKVIQTLY